MPAEIVMGEFCASYYGTYIVPSSKPGRSYDVTLNGGEAAPHCTCKAWEFAPYDDKQCKHTREVWSKACLWNCQWHEGNRVAMKPDSIHYCPEGIPGRECPNCHGPVVPVKIAV